MKISTVCEACGVTFERFAAFHRHAAKRGTVIKFCSRACTDKARSSGIIGAKKKRGEDLTCEVCSASFYRPASMLKSGKSRFCSEECRLEAHRRKLVDRTGPRPNRKLGKEISCTVCGEVKYRKESFLAAGSDKTCGAPECRSVYGRSLWSLPPRPEEDLKAPRAARKRRPHEFRRKDRRAWMDTQCARCGTNENLTLDHIIPVCHGGTSTKDNAQTLCGPCNNWKARHEDIAFKGRNLD